MATPIPWKWNRAQAVYQLRGPNNEYIGHVDHSQGRLTQEANAELIVNSVNAHAALVKALETARDSICLYHCQITGSKETQGKHVKVCAASTAALKLAKGKK